jgi:phage terminase Nu1 subunit (DNA packaging protein)
VPRRPPPPALPPTTLTTVNAREMARLLNVSARTIADWVNRGAPCAKRGRPGVSAEFDPREFIAWWKDHVVLASAPKVESLDLAEQRIDLEIKELRLRQQKGELVPRAAAVAVINSLHAQLVALLRQTPRRFGPRLVGLADIAAAVAMLVAIVEEQVADLRVPDLWRTITDGTGETP